MIDDRNQETGSKCFINTERFAWLNTVAQRSQVIVCIRETEFLYAQIFRNGKEVIDKDLILAGLVNVKCQQTFTRINKTTRQIIDRCVLWMLCGRSSPSVSIFFKTFSSRCVFIMMSSL